MNDLDIRKNKKVLIDYSRFVAVLLIGSAVVAFIDSKSIFGDYVFFYGSMITTVVSYDKIFDRNKNVWWMGIMFFVCLSAFMILYLYFLNFLFS